MSIVVVPTFIKIFKMSDDLEEEFDVASTVVENDGEFVEDEEAVAEITSLLDDVGIIDSESGLVEYKGNMVRKEVRDVMKSVVDQMQHHMGRDQFPNISFSLDTLKHLAYDQNYKAKNEDPADKWWSPLNIKYNGLGGLSSPVVAFDGVYLDLTPHMKKGGSPMKGYGLSWANVYIPSKTMKEFTSKVKEFTQWTVSSKGLNADKGQGLVSIVGNINQEGPPRFYSMSMETNEHDEPSGRIVTKSVGNVVSVASDSELQAIYKCTMFCTVSVSVVTAVGTTVCPTPSNTTYARLKFNVLSIKAYGVAENVRTISLSGSKVSSRLF